VGGRREEEKRRKGQRSCQNQARSNSRAPRKLSLRPQQQRRQPDTPKRYTNEHAQLPPPPAPAPAPPPLPFSAHLHRGFLAEAVAGPWLNHHHCITTAAAAGAAAVAISVRWGVLLLLLALQGLLQESRALK